ncbi:MAG: hypothetical protein J6D52_11910 [Clostridia bacterium]|nr:hypothetical protein [Clostridia bacterium]
MNNQYPVQRNLDGIYARVERNGKYVNRCFTDLTEAEQNRFMRNLDYNGLITLCIHITQVLRNIADQCDISCEE